jgi:hypothetical protein
MPISFTKTTHPINFSALSGHEFERLVFATVLRMRLWRSLNWQGQSGSDGGRDVIGVCDDQIGNPKTVVIACANWKTFTLAKAIGDIDSFIKTLGGPPSEVIVVAGSAVSSDIKDKIDVYARAKGIEESQTWSGAEFEEFLRFHAPSVLDRFFNGVELPDDDHLLRDFVHNLTPVTGTEAAEMLANVFRRPAFTTPIQNESSLPAFKQAIGDTINALNTGIWRDREQAIVARVPSIGSFSGNEVANSLVACVENLNKLRIAFDDGLRKKTIVPCGCTVPDCPTFMMTPAMSKKLQSQRSKAMRDFAKALKLLRAS